MAGAQGQLFADSTPQPRLHRPEGTRVYGAIIYLRTDRKCTVRRYGRTRHLVDGWVCDDADLIRLAVSYGWRG